MTKRWTAFLALLLLVAAEARAQESPLPSLWVTIDRSITLGRFSAPDNDIVGWGRGPQGDQVKCIWLPVFHGADVGLTTGIASFDALPAGQFVMVLKNAQRLPG